jgi:hypothetical protein
VDVGESTSIALDGDGKVHIGYRDNTNTALKYATNTSGSWVTKTIDNSADVGYAASIVLGKNGKVHISYRDDTNSTLKYATNASGKWVTKTVDNSTYIRYSTSIAIDNGGKVHIISSIGALLYTTNASGAWVTTMVDDSEGVGCFSSSIALDRSGKVHVSYSDSVHSSEKYSTNASGAWVTTTVDDSGYVGGWTSIAVGGGKVHISYHELPVVSSSLEVMSGRIRQINNGVVASYALKYATNASGQWTTTTVDNSSRYVGMNNSIAIDSSGKVHISYYDETITSLKYAIGP